MQQGRSSNKRLVQFVALLLGFWVMYHYNAAMTRILNNLDHDHDHHHHHPSRGGPRRGPRRHPSDEDEEYEEQRSRGPRRKSPKKPKYEEDEDEQPSRPKGGKGKKAHTVLRGHEVDQAQNTDSLRGPGREEPHRGHQDSGADHDHDHDHDREEHQQDNVDEEEAHAGKGKCRKPQEQPITGELKGLVLNPAWRPAPNTDKEDLCPICGSKKHTKFATENSYTLARCDRCDFLYLNPIPFHLKPDQKTVKERWEHPKVPAMERKIREFYTRDELANLKNWLDVGAGNGELLKAIKQTAPNIEVLGVEEAQHKINTAKSKGLPVERKPLSDFPDCSFDVVTVMNVLSHVPRPLGFFAELGRLVKPGGCIWMSTGNAADVELRSQIPGRLDLPDHFIFAGKKHMYTIFHRIGFEIKQYTEFLHFWHNYRPFPKGPFRAIYLRACRPE